MLIDPSLITASSQQNTGASSLSDLGEDYNSFLTLLTAQIQYQDPLEPVDGTEFVAQLAQLTQVEQAVRQNDQLQSLTAQFAGALNVAGADFLGRNAQFESDQIILGPDGAISQFELAANAQSVRADIIDPLGRVVRTIQGLPTTEGTSHTISWDGFDEFGTAQLDGTYRVSISAVDAADNVVDVTQYRDAEVSEVLFNGGLLEFKLVDGELVSAGNVKSVR
ncbi:MAG: flagellar hook assembly protein FlgD [Rhodobacteraceae bacterium]|nr:flagellar hook assembly protein FlgD [Paracoccaceae bacterium]